MVEENAALAVLGNHELNAIAYATEDPDNAGEFMRRHTKEKVHQHLATLEQFPNASEWNAWLDWFRTLPFSLDLGKLRVVHACWDEDLISSIQRAIASQKKITTEFIQHAYNQDTDMFNAVEIVLKGREAELPVGLSFFDKGGMERTSIRTKWYLPADGMSYKQYAFQSEVVECDAMVTDMVLKEAKPYPLNAPPVFVGHYWLRAPAPHRLTHNVACLDFSVAKDGFLCAYRWDEEQSLADNKFVW